MTTDQKPSPVDPQQPSEQSSPTIRKHFDVAFYRDWCKACGICIAFCPRKIIHPDKNGKPLVVEPDQCIGCRFCEIHCPDFAITVTERQLKRRKGDA